MMLVGQVVLVVVLSSVAVGEVVPNYTQTCPQFFADPGGTITPPTGLAGNQYKQICQKQANQNVYKFATYYDTNNRIPVFSAYVYAGRQKCERKNKWYIEPQLDDQNKGPSMAADSSATLSKPPRGDNQALNDDYVGSGYDRGHLYPVFHTNTQSCANSTFTLTNAAPQHPSFNRGEWKNMETRLANAKCQASQAFVVTGVVPSTNPQVLLKNRVNVPTHFWNAYCCLNQNQIPTSSGGYLSTNDQTPGQYLTVAALEQQLSNLYGAPFQVFGGQCP